MKCFKVCLTTAAVTSALLASSAMAAEANFNGYMRAGSGISAHSGANQSFDKNKVGRLGNENDVYGEIGIDTAPIKVEGTDAEFTVNSMMAFGDVDGSNGWEVADVSLVQFNVQAKGLFDFDKEATLWAGKRYYQRHDIHITDFYYWNTNGGAGGGLENLTLGPGKLSVAFIRDDANTDTGTLDTNGDPINTPVNVNNFDIRYAGLGLWQDASLELGFNYYMVNESDANKTYDINTDDSMMLTAELTQGNFIGGFNKTVLQAGNNGIASQMAGLGSGSWTAAETDGDIGYRIINWGVINLAGSWDIGHQVMYAVSTFDDSSKDDHTFANAVIRPVYSWNSTMKTELEAGYYIENDSANQDASGSKFTVAQAWSAGSGFWARPEIRLYASYVMDHENDDRFGTGNSSEMSVGIQAEAWW